MATDPTKVKQVGFNLSRPIIINHQSVAGKYIKNVNLNVSTVKKAVDQTISHNTLSPTNPDMTQPGRLDNLYETKSDGARVVLTDSNYNTNNNAISPSDSDIIIPDKIDEELAAQQANYNNYVAGISQQYKTNIANSLLSNAFIFIKDSSGKGIYNVAVSTIVNGTVATATTDIYGLASFYNIPIATYTFTASLTGYNLSSTQVNVITNVNGQGTITLYPVPATPFYGTALVQVEKNSDNSAIKGALVSTIVNGNTISKLTDSNGIAQFDVLPDAQYSFSVSATGYTSASVNITVSSNISTTGTIKLIASA